MADVAHEAGVSLMTVSRVINEKGDVSDDTRQRVLAVVERMDFRPSGIARSLATQRTGTIGLVVPDISNPFFADVPAAWQMPLIWRATASSYVAVTKTPPTSWNL